MFKFYERPVALCKSLKRFISHKNHPYKRNSDTWNSIFQQPSKDRINTRHSFEEKKLDTNLLPLSKDQNATQNLGDVFEENFLPMNRYNIINEKFLPANAEPTDEISQKEQFDYGEEFEPDDMSMEFEEFELADRYDTDEENKRMLMPVSHYDKYDPDTRDREFEFFYDEDDDDIPEKASHFIKRLEEEDEFDRNYSSQEMKPGVRYVVREGIEPVNPEKYEGITLYKDEDDFNSEYSSRSDYKPKNRYFIEDNYDEFIEDQNLIYNDSEHDEEPRENYKETKTFKYLHPLMIPKN